MQDLNNLKRKVIQYKEVLNNTEMYRKEWKEKLKAHIISTMENLIKESGLDATVELKETVEHLEAIVISLGQRKSGIYEKVNDDLQRHLIKHNGALIYQQLFNGKVVVLINYPMIEGYGEPRPPRNIAIYRPEELEPPFFIRHLEELVKEVTNWEDYDDDEPSQSNPRIGFNMNLLDASMQDGQ